MIKQMIKAILKFPTYPLRKQVTQWYDAGDTDQRYLNPIEVVRAILCTESTETRHMKDLITHSIGDRDSLAPYLPMSTLMMALAEPNGSFNRRTTGVTRVDLIVPSMCLSMDGSILFEGQAEALITSGALTARRFRPRRDEVIGKGINKPIGGTSFFLDEAVAVLTRRMVKDCYNVAAFVAGMQFFMLEHSRTYAHCAYRPVGSFALRAIPEPLMPMMFKLVKAVPLLNVIADDESCHARMAPSEVLVTMSLSPMEVAEALFTLVKVRSHELRETLLLENEEFEQLCSIYETRYSRDGLPRVHDGALRIDPMPLEALRQRCAFLCEHLHVEAIPELRGPTGETGRPRITRANKPVAATHLRETAHRAIDSSVVDMNDVLMAHMIMQNLCATGSQSVVISQERGTSTNEYMEAPRTVDEPQYKAECSVPEAAYPYRPSEPCGVLETPRETCAAPEPSYSPDTYSASDCDSSTSTSNDY